MGISHDFLSSTGHHTLVVESKTNEAVTRYNFYSYKASMNRHCSLFYWIICYAFFLKASEMKENTLDKMEKNY